MRILILHNAVAADAAPDERDVLDEVAAVAASLARRATSPPPWAATWTCPSSATAWPTRVPTSSSTSWRAWAARAA